jgi:hypothetical protein
MQKIVFYIILFFNLFPVFGQLVTDCEIPSYMVFTQTNFSYDFTKWDWTNSDPCNWIAHDSKGYFFLMKPAFDEQNTNMNARMLEINRNKDFLNDDPTHLIQEDQGWELLWTNFSNNYPYFVLYNKYRSTLRIYFYLSGIDMSSNMDEFYIKVTLTNNGIATLSNNKIPTHNLTIAGADASSFTYSHTITDFIYSSWISADYNITFDQRVPESNTNISIQLSGRKSVPVTPTTTSYTFLNYVSSELPFPGQSSYNNTFKSYQCPLGIIGYQDPIEIKNTSDYIYDTPIPDYKILGQTIPPGKINKSIEGYQGTFCKFRVSNTPHFVFNATSQMDFVNMKAGLIITPTYQDPSSPFYYDITSEYIQTVVVTTTNYPSQHVFKFKNPLYPLLQSGEAEIITLTDGRKACLTSLKAIECLQNYTLELPVHSNIYLSTYTTFNKSTFSTPITLHYIYAVKNTWVNTGPTMTISSNQEYPYFPKSDYSSSNCSGVIRPITDYYTPLTCDNSLVTSTQHPQEVEKIIVISPNPNNGTFQYSIPFTPGGNYELYLLNSSGEVVYLKRAENLTTTNEIQLNLPPGLYLLKIISNGKSYYSKVIIQ